MRKEFQKVLLAILVCAAASAMGQSDKVKLPNIPGFYTLKCDFHCHTAFSDGHVWPSLRVTEAIRDGLDVISITDHIDYQGFPDDVKKDYNRPYEIARECAENTTLIVIQGGEISPRVPPYHHNAIFLEDVNKLPVGYMEETRKKFLMKGDIKKEELTAPFMEAKKQGAFVFYNHPGYSWWDQKDTTIFTALHEELLQEGIINGIEVVNSGKYNIIAHQLAEKYNLTILGNSDEHADIYYRYKDSHRPMTLVFVEEKSQEGIKEALMERRTAIYVEDYIIARQTEAEALFKASLEISFKKETRKKGEPVLIVSIVNKSDVPYQVRMGSEYNIESYPLGQTTFAAQDTTQVIIKELWEYPRDLTLQVDVLNVVTSPENHLKTNILLDLKE